MTEPPKLTLAGKIVVLFIIGGCFLGAYYFFFYRKPVLQPAAPVQSEKAAKAPEAGLVEIGIAYGTEKKRWLEWAVKEFAETKDGQRIKVNLIPMGSLEGARAILSGDRRITVWSPASAVYKDVFVQEWTGKHGSNPIIKEENLALTPMVFVMWEERYKAFINKYQNLSFKTISRAIGEKGGWVAIAGKPEWGIFKFGHTNPNKSNSGMMALVLMAYDFHDQCQGLTLKDILNVDFQNWMQDLEMGTSGMLHSTGPMMRDMVLKGPSTYDAIFVYESLAIDYLKNAEGRWGTLKVVYPEKNSWNDNPWYLIDASWSSPDQRDASNRLLEFLMSEPIQKQSLVHGFRPGNPNVPVKFPDSPFVRYEKYGIKVDLTTVCEPPKAEVINNLIGSWLRYQRPK